MHVACGEWMGENTASNDPVCSCKPEQGEFHGLLEIARQGHAKHL